MEPVTLRFSADTIDTLDEEADEHGLSRAKYVREVVRNRHEADAVRDEYEAKADQLRDEYEAKLEQLRDEHEATTDELRDELDELQTENDRLRREKRQVLDVRDENTELVRFAEAEKERRDREHDRRTAPAWRRAKWWLLGEPDNTPENK